jgi:hypothetical protein
MSEKYCQPMYFSLLYGKPVNWHSVGDILSEIKNVSICCHPCFNTNIGGGQSVAL